MPVIVDPFILDQMAGHQGAFTFVLKEVADRAGAVAGMHAARRAVSAISGVVETGDGARFTVDLPAGATEADDGLLERVLGAVVDALAAAGVETGLLTFDAPDDPSPAPSPPAAPTSQRLTFRSSPLGVPIPNPHRFLWGNGNAAGYLLPHDREQLIAFYEGQRGVILSVEVDSPDEPPQGLVYAVVGGVLIRVGIRDAGKGRNLEISVDRDRAVVELAVNRLRSEPLPDGTRVRVDRR